MDELRLVSAGKPSRARFRRQHCFAGICCQIIPLPFPCLVLSMEEVAESRDGEVVEASCLNILFSKRSMDRLANEGSCEAFVEAAARFAVASSGATKGDILRDIYSYMLKNYRNEYIYKSLMLKKIVYGRHNPKTASAICELPVGGSVADFVLLNGKACVYEIKTDLDNLARLTDQLKDYYQAFRYVSVVCSEGAVDGVLDFLGESPVGVMALTKRLTFRVLREPSCWERGIDPFTQFDLLRKGERDEVLRLCGEDLPDVAPVKYYSACLSLFQGLDPDARVLAFEKVLKKRGARVNQAALALYPEEFRLVAYNRGASFVQGKRLREFAESAM